MNVVDSSAWLSYFTGEANSRIFAKAIEDTKELIVPTIIITEVFKTILRERGEDSALEAIGHMHQGEVISLDKSLALDAAHYGVEFKLPLADSIIYATARKFDAVLWTQDVDFAPLDGVKYFPKETLE